MHGRIKVKTTAEQQEAKRKEREKKLKVYNAGSQAVMKKKTNNEFDDEGLQISGELLSVNPDYYTLWNYRREAFIHLRETRTPDEMQKMLTNELHFLEQCLKVNPKSYGTWHHRCFVMDIIPEPDWARELHLCSLFLQTDERNFHCWDYRRHIVLQADVPLKDELAYSTEKIHSNFSNYSSWHYRSKLLPLIHPDNNNHVGVQEEVLLKEFEVVQNAFYTDPDDQSAWFYQRWLLGRGQRKLQICCVHVSRTLQRILVLLSRPIMVGRGYSLCLSIGSNSVEGKWKTVTGQVKYSTLWVMDLPENVLPDSVQTAVAVTLQDDRYCTNFSEGLSIDPKQQEMCVVAEFKQGSRFSTELSAAATTTIEQELEGIKELHNVEPNNKWVLLTMLYLMMAVDPKQDVYSAEIEESFHKLISVDVMRKAYYQDLRSRFLIESVLETQDSKLRDVKLCKRGLSCLYHTDWMVLVTSLDLSQNSLSSTQHLCNLQCLQYLNLDGNNLTDLRGLGYCKALSHLSVKNNEIKQADIFQELKDCHFLTKLYVFGNPVCAITDFEKKIKSTLKTLKYINDEDSIS